jgi:predicted transcriptional regulator
MKPGEYREHFDIPRTQSLTANSFSESRRAMAFEHKLADVLANARKARAEKVSGHKEAR